MPPFSGPKNLDRVWPKVRRRRTGDDFHGLDCVQRKLVGKEFAVLIGYGLVVQRNGRLGVVTERVKEAVGVRSDTGRAVSDDRAQGAVRTGEWYARGDSNTRPLAS